MYDIFEKLLKENNVTAYKVSKATGIASSTFSDWKSGRSIPKHEKLQKLADYFNVPISYFITNDGLSNKKYDDKTVVDYIYSGNESVLSPFLAKYIKLKRIEADYTEKCVAINSEIDIDRYVRFESYNIFLNANEIYYVMKFLNINIDFIFGAISTLLFALKSIEDIDASQNEKKLLNEIFLSKYDLYKLEKESENK